MLLIALTLAAATDATAPQCRGVTLSAMVADYAGLLRTQSADQIARLYRTDGTIVNPGAPPIRGEAAVRALLSGIKGVTVHQARMDVDIVAPASAGWQVTGRFSQNGVANGKDFSARGHFDSQWECDGQGWRIRRMATSP